MELQRKTNKIKSATLYTKKYFLDICDKALFKLNTNTREWLIIKNIILDKKVIEGLMNNNYKVVIKTSLNDLIEKEYNMSNLIKNCKGFVKYICKFSCNDNLNKYIKENTEIIGDSFCQETGIKTDYIIMPYYPLGNLTDYTWNKDNFNEFKRCLKEVVKNLLCAAKNYNFIHNDLHSDNIMLSRSFKNGRLKTHIIDFETSLIYNGSHIEKVIVIDIRRLVSKLLFIDTSKIIKWTTNIRDTFNDTTFDSLYDVYDLIDELKYIPN